MGGNMGGGVPPHMALAYQLSGMGISGPPRPNANPMGVMPMMPHAYAPAAAAAAPMAVIGTDSKAIKIRGLPFRWVRVMAHHDRAKAGAHAVCLVVFVTCVLCGGNS